MTGRERGTIERTALCPSQADGRRVGLCGQVCYFFGCAAFHFAQRARCAAAMRFRAAADMVLRFPMPARPRPRPRLVPVRRLKTLMAASNFSTSFCVRVRSCFNCWTVVAKFSMVSLGLAFYQRRPRHEGTLHLTQAKTVSEIWRDLSPITVLLSRVVTEAGFKIGLGRER